MKQFIFILLWWVSGVATAQEICNNGIDDDSDGQIDCADGDCFSEGYCPTVFDQTPAVCEDSFGSGNATVDLTTYDASVTGGVSHTVNWYQDTSAVGNPIIPIITPTSYTVANGDILFAEVDNGTNQDIASITFTINNIDDASFSYTSANYCEDASNPTPNSISTSGGIFSNLSGLVFVDNATGEVNLSVSPLGTHTITYTTSGACPSSSTFGLTISGRDDASFNYAGSPYCPTDTDPVAVITGDTGGTFSAPAGLVINGSTGEIDLSSSTPGNHTVTYTTGGICPDSSTLDVEVIDNGEAVAQPAANITCDAFTASWNPVFGATSYEIDVAEDEFFSAMVSGYNAASTSDTFLDVTGLTATQTYYYQVRVVTSCGTSFNSDTISVEVLGIPGAVTNLTASNPTCSGFKVSWNTVTYASSYLLEVSNDGFVTKDISQSIPSTSLTLASLDQGMVYEYRVTPQNVCGAGPASTGTYQTNDVPPAPVPVPVNLTASNITCNGVDISWNPVLDADDYLVEIDDDPTFVSIDDLQTVALFDYTVSGLTTSTQYFYRVTPNNSCGAGSTSIAGTFTTDSLPSAPVDTLLLVEHNQVTVAWESIINADTYSVEVATDNLFGSIVSTTVLDSTRAEVAGLIPLTTYYLRILANNTCGSGSFSDTLIFATPQDPLVIDSLALVDFYNATDGHNWIDNANWLTDEINTWQGVTITDNRVVRLELSNNDLSGSFPASMDDLTGLEYADLQDNTLTGTLGAWISNFSEPTDSFLVNGNQLSDIANSISYTPGNIDIADNEFTFEDLLLVVDSLPSLTYAPQAKVGSTLNTFRNVGDSYTLSLGIYASLADNQYVWYRDGVAVDTTTVGEYVMDTIIISDDGEYICEVTNLAAPNLTLVSNPMTVNVQAKPNSLIFTPVADVNFGTVPFVLNASASSGLPVLFEVIEGDSLVDIQGDVVTTLGIGQVTVRATQPGDDFHEAATPITRQFTINQGSQTIAFTAINDQDIALADSVELAISASSGLPIDFIIDGLAELNGNILLLLDTGTVTVTATQAGNELYQPAFPVSQSFLVFTSDTIPPAVEPPVDSTLEYSVRVQITSTDNAPSVTASLHKASGSSFSTVQEKPLVSGSGVFSNVAGGFYSILLTPTDATHLPTYLGGRLTLAQANILEVNQNTISSIALISKPDTTAQQGVAVGGSLIPEGSAGGRLEESAMAGISVYLVNAADQSIVGYGVTNGEGKFYFPNIPPGDYFFLADYEGVDLRDNQIEVDNNSLILSVEVGKFIRIVSTEEGEVLVPPALVTSVDQIPNESVRAYPNPVIDRMTIEIPTNWLGSQAIVTNTTGQQVAYQILNQTRNNLSIKLLPAGLYYVQIKDKDQSNFIKIVKK